LLLTLGAAYLPAAEPAPADKKDAGLPWQSLFDGKTLTGWKSAMFGGEGDVETEPEKGLLILNMGEPLTGVTFQDPKKLLRNNYEISLECMRMQGTDFFCGLTFPVREKEHCSFIVGGWGGGLCGISCIDGFDASENETTAYKEFKSDRWYKIRVKVTDDKLATWIDDEKIVDVVIKDRKLSTRIEVDLNQPFGVSTYRTKSALKDIKIRPLPPAAK
jgi:hypothetical protein